MRMFVLQLGFRQEWLSRTFWVMALGMGIAAIGVGAFANLMVDRFALGLASPTFVAAAIAALCVFLVLNGWVENVGTQPAQLSKALVNACQALTGLFYLHPSFKCSTWFELSIGFS